MKILYFLQKTTRNRGFLCFHCVVSVENIHFDEKYKNKNNNKLLMCTNDFYNK